MQDPVPFAINYRGDAVLQLCPSGGCLNGPSGSWYPYLYDARLQHLIPLARFNSYPTERYYPYAINDRGLIVGTLDFYNGTTWGEVAVSWTRVGKTGSQVSLLDPRPGMFSSAYGINERNVIVGADGPSLGMQYPASFTPNGPVLLAPGNLSVGTALAVSYPGLAVGNFNGDPEIFSGPNGIPVPGIGPLGQIEPATALAVDDLGNVLGDYMGQGPTGSSTQEGFFYNAATGTSSNIMYGDSTYVNGMNRRDDYVGEVVEFGPYPPNGPFAVGPDFFSFLLTDMLPQNIAIQPVTALAINNCDQIVGQGYVKGISIAYLFEPVHSTVCKGHT